MGSILNFILAIVIAELTNALPQKPYRLIVPSFSYIVQCDINNPNNSALIVGYEPSLLHDAMNYSNLTYGEDIVFECVTTDTFLTTLSSVGPDNSIIGGFGAWPMESQFLKTPGMSFSVSTMQSGLSIGYFKSNSSLIGNLYYLQAFHWNLYLVILLLPMLLGFMLYIFQMKNQDCLNYLHHFYSYLFRLEFLKGLNIESRLVESIFQLTMVILLTLFTAHLTNEFSQQRSFKEINSINDVRGRLERGI